MNQLELEDRINTKTNRKQSSFENLNRITQKWCGLGRRGGGASTFLKILMKSHGLPVFFQLR